MNYPAEADIIGMLRHLVSALCAFAKAQEVDLSFQSDHEELVISYHPEEITTDIIGLICRVVAYTPPTQSVMLSAVLVQEPGKHFLKITLQNTGINLLRIGQITQDCKHPVTIQCLPNGGTIYELQWQLNRSVAPSHGEETDRQPNISQIFPNFYAEVRRHLRSHFTKADNLIALLSSRHPKDAAFLQKVNTLILTNIDKDGFDANHLSIAMRMSRAQLYRRLQPIIRQAPGCYIKTMRIQKAKELLETTDMRIGEVAFKTGFQTPSHFTRVFIQHYGVKPSLFCRNNKM